jgi:SAM-dependent methyltransferase
MSHRSNILVDIDKLLKDISVKDLNCLELGAGGKEDFKEKFEEHNVKEWIMTDRDTEVYMESLPYEDNSFDLVFSSHAFEHCEAPLQALKEMKRVSKDWIIIVTPHHCEHQVLNADEDHIFVLTEMQMKRLFKYCDIPIYKIYTQKLEGKKEQDYNLISIGRLLK